MSAIRPFTLAVPQDRIDDLHARLDLARWPEKEPVEDWSQGVPLAALQDLVAYWRNGYDWRPCEARLNALGQYLTEIDGLDIHFLHVRSPHEGAVPLLLTHGWPGSVVEFLECIGPLADPVAHGGKAGDAFHLVVPSLPGYGFSGKPDCTGWNVARVGEAWAVLMDRLGYDRWFAQGGDWGGIITTWLGARAPKGLAGIHTNMPLARRLPEDRQSTDPRAIAALEAGDRFYQWDTGYSKIQGTRPQTIGYALVDSPVALAGWIYEKMWSWTDNRGRPEDALSRDAMLDNIMIYWLTASGASAARMYWESSAMISLGDLEVHLPTAVTTFPREITVCPREWAERSLRNVVYWNDCDRGGHFAAWEEPDLFVAELRKGFALMR